MKINGREVEMHRDYASRAAESPQFQEWLRFLDPRFNVKSIHFQSIDFSHSHPDRVLFIKFEAEVYDETGEQVFPGIVFMRGGSVAILFILRCEGKKYALVTIQKRFPMGYYTFAEIPAGMLDGDGNFSGVAAKEIKEETGFVIDPTKLIDLTELAYEGAWRGVFSSVGGSDEYLRLFAIHEDIEPEDLKKLKGKLTGAASENEHIILGAIPFEDLPFLLPDAKSLCAYLLYQELKKIGRI